MQLQNSYNSKFVGGAHNGGMPEEQFQDIADRLIQAQNALGLSQAEFARRAKIPPRSMNNWQSGRYRISINGALKLRETYGLDLEFIFCGNVTMLPNKIASALKESPRDSHSK